jgi:hypothetical protein
MGNGQRHAGWTRVWAVGAVGVALTVLVPAGVASASSTVPAPQAALTITCNELDLDLPNVFGRDCDGQTWGPVANFTVTNRDSGESYSCETGWQEGSQWVNGQDCVPAN